MCGCVCSHLFVRASHFELEDPSLVRKQFFFSLLITLQSLHLSVHQTELMDLSADRQTARCQLCSVLSDNALHVSSLKLTAQLLDCIVEKSSASACVLCFVGLVWLFVHFCVCVCGSFSTVDNRDKHVKL